MRSEASQTLAGRVLLTIPRVETYHEVKVGQLGRRISKWRVIGEDALKKEVQS